MEMDPINLAFIVGAIIIYYFLLIRPKIRANKEKQTFQTELATGHQVKTKSGIYGKIANINDETVLLQVDNSTKIRVDRQQIERIPEKKVEKEKKK